MPQSELLRGRLRQLAFMLGAFVVATLLAKLFGAGWGTASGVGQIAFVVAVVGVIVAGPR